MQNDNSIVSRYVASPYSYHGNGSRARSWSVWDTKNECWVNSEHGGIRIIGTKEEAKAIAKRMTDAGQVDHGNVPSDDVNLYCPLGEKR